MKAILVTLAVLTLVTTTTYSQSHHKIPVTYSVYKDYDNKTFRLGSDLDDDGTGNLVIMLAKKRGGENAVAVFLSNSYATSGTENNGFLSMLAGSHLSHRIERLFWQAGACGSWNPAINALDRKVSNDLGSIL